MKPKPDYGYYLVDIERDGTDPQPGDQYWCTLHCKWIDRIRPKLPLDENYTYRRRVPEIEGYRLLGLDEVIVPGTIFFVEEDSDRDFADPDRHIQTAHQWSSVRHVIDHFINHCHYVAFYAPVEKPEKKSEANGWLPIEQFDADRHLPCWVTNGKTYKFASFRHEGRDRKSTRLNSSHVAISYAVFCLTKT